MPFRKLLFTGISIAFWLAGWTAQAQNSGLAASPDALFFRQVGSNSAPPAPRRLNIHTRGDTTLGAFSADVDTATGGNWLSVSPSNGTGNTSLTASVNPSGLTPGIYSGVITITAAGIAGSPLEIPVTLELLTTPVGRAIGQPPELIVQPGKLKFKVSDDAPAPPSRHVLIHRPAGDAFAWTAVATILTPAAGTWLILNPVSPASGQGRSILEVSVDPTDLAEGEYEGRIVVTSGSNTSTVEVELEVEAEGDGDDDDGEDGDDDDDEDDQPGQGQGGPRGPKLLVTPQALNFIVVTNSLRPLETKTLRVRSTGRRSNVLDWTATATVDTPAGGDWLSIDPDSGDSPDEIIVTADPDGLAPGMYSGKITIESGDQDEDVRVFLRIVGSSQSSIRIRPRALRFTATPGPGGSVSPASLPVTIDSDAEGLTFTALATTASGGDWLEIDPESGPVPGEITASVVASVATTLAPGVYAGQIEVNIGGASQEVHTIQVTLKVFGPDDTPRLVVNPAAVSFVGSEGGANPAAKPVRLRPEGTASIDWTASVSVATPQGGNWLAASALAGTASAGVPSAVDVSATLGSLPRGNYTGTITFTPTAPAGILPVQLRVHLIVRRAGTGVSTLSFGRTPRAAIASGDLIAFFTEPADGFISQVDAPPVLGVTVLDSEGAPVEGASVVIQSSSGEPDLALTDVGGGQYEGSLRPLSSGLAVLTGSADSGGQSAAVFGVYGDIESAAGPPTIIFQHGAVSGASFAPGPRPLAPGSIASLFGLNIGRGLAIAPGLPLPDSLDGVTVTVGGIRARIFGISTAGDQINFQIPAALRGQAQADAVVNNNGVLSPPEPILLGVSPALFTHSNNGRGPAAAQHDLDSSVVSAARPAVAGEVVRLYATGLGAVLPEVADGAAPDGLSITVGTVTVTIGGIPAEVLFSGLAPGFAALFQVNVRVPDGVPPGNAAVDILVDGTPASGQATLHVR